MVVHRLLEEYTRSVGRPTADEVGRAAVEAAEAMDLDLSPEDAERAVRLTLAVWDSPAGARLASPRSEAEVPFFFVSEGVRVTGIMDLVCRDEDCWYVTDYKTNSLRGRSIELVSQGYALQRAVYGLAALRAGAPAIQMELVFLERPGEPVSVKYHPADMPELEREFARAVLGMRQGHYARREGEECAHCSVRATCGRMVAE